MTKYGRPESVAPASSTRAMFGWSIKARACRSASKRAMTCRVSMPSLMIFSATRRRTGALLVGHVDHAHAPFADLLQELVGTDQRADVLGQGRGRNLVDRRQHCRRLVEKAVGIVVGLKQGLDTRAQSSASSADSFIQETPPARPVVSRWQRGIWTWRGFGSTITAASLRVRGFNSSCDIRAGLSHVIGKILQIPVGMLVALSIRNGAKPAHNSSVDRQLHANNRAPRQSARSRGL